MKIKKFVIVTDKDSVTGFACRVFPYGETHKQVYAELSMFERRRGVTLHSAGFCKFEPVKDAFGNIVDGQWGCFGESSSLGVGAKEDSAKILNAFM